LPPDEKPTGWQVEKSRDLSYRAGMNHRAIESRSPGRPVNPITREEIAIIAREAFAEAGYAATSLSQIAEAVGIRKASLYHHYSTKDALYNAVIGGIVSGLRTLVAGAGLEAGSFIERLDRLGALVVDYLTEHPSAARLLVREIVDDGPFMRGEGRDGVQAALRITEAFLEAGMEAGTFRRQDVRQLTLSIVGLHLFYFAADHASSTFLEHDIFSNEVIRDRKAAILLQARSLCLGADVPTD
jgi:TetR/AcrR family transcriptional regulator